MNKMYAASGKNISRVWAELFFKLMSKGVTELAPVMVSISEFDDAQLPIEVPGVRDLLDNFNKQSCRTIGGTIFPSSLWSPGDPPEKLYERYERIWPRVAKCPPNKKGVYFRRLTAYQPHSEAGSLPRVNQLTHVIETFKGENHRHSALQAAIFDPTRDHSHTLQRGFPCLQQVAFGVDAHAKELMVTGSYALQHHVTKAYGNYLGLCWLGRFMAEQMGLRLVQVNCFASSLKLGNDLTKASLEPLKEELSRIVQDSQLKVA